MAGATVHFLLVYSYAEGKLIEEPKRFTRSADATVAYDMAERAYRDQTGFEIVLVGSDSIETVMTTHGHYFHRSDDSFFSDFLRPAAAATVS